MGCGSSVPLPGIDICGPSKNCTSLNLLKQHIVYVILEQYTDNISHEELTRGIRLIRARDTRIYIHYSNSLLAKIHTLSEPKYKFRVSRMIRFKKNKEEGVKYWHTQIPL